MPKPTRTADERPAPRPAPRPDRPPLGGWLARRLATLKADLSALTSELRGQRLPPVIRVGRQPPRHGLAPLTPPAAPPAVAAAPATRSAEAPRAVTVTARVTLDGETHALTLRTDAPILAQALDAGVPLPYSCQAGGCGACRLRCLSGSVALPEDHALDADELAAGFVLTCVGVATSDLVLAEEP
jgi:ferredoxin